MTMLALVSFTYLIQTTFPYLPSHTPTVMHKATLQQAQVFAVKDQTTISISHTISAKEKPLPTPEIKTSPAELEDLFSKYAQEYNVDISLLKKIAYCESKLNPTASFLSYVGLFQFSPNTWQAYRKRMGLNDDIDIRKNPEESIKTAAYVISHGGVGAWPHCSK